jgi:hypothetical protein
VVYQKNAKTRLSWIFKKWFGEEGAWTGLICLRTGADGGLVLKL